MNVTGYGDASLIWAGDCTGFTASPVMPNTTNSRVCGYKTTNTSALQSCCNGGRVEQYQCWSYCAYTDKIATFNDCVNSSTSSYDPEELFCQSGLAANVTQSLKTSFGSKSYSAPRIGWVVVALLFAVLFVNPATATIIPSLDNTGLVRRQSTSCTFSKDQDYAKLGRQIKVTNNIQGATFEGPFTIDTGINNNNRTINGTSAADAQFDQIFEIVGNATGRVFPAQSSLQVTRELAHRGGDGFLSWGPFLYCVNGTVTNCKGVLGDTNNAAAQEFCGPTFAENNVTTANVKSAVIQGNFGFVVTT